MKRSEMIEKLRDYFFGEEVRPEPFCGLSNKVIEDFSDSILTFLESHGMQPPQRDVKGGHLVPAEDGQEAMLTYSIVVNEWEPEISQETIDQALEHLGKKGVRGEMEITE